MPEPREERRLAAIVIGDVVGYSRLMGLDEIGTMTALKAHRRDLILPLLADYRARLVNSTGDAMLLEFGSAVDAVACAATLQRGMLARNAAIAPDRQIRFRLGANLGDVVVDGDDLYGDGVNVAARLETLCDPGGLCLSRAMEEQVKDKLPFSFEDRGEQTLKNIARPVRVYALTPAFIATLPDPTAAAEPRPVPTAQLQVTPGTTLNDAYSVDRLIGSGGMGEIFEGHEIHTGDTVAIKLIRLDMEGNDAALGLFQKEASVLKHLYHEAVVRYYVFSFDQTVRRHYLAMEYVDGPSLSATMQSGPLPFEAVDALRRRVAEGLQAAHARGVVHRDVSPDNIILPGADVTRAKIIDFGIARSASLGGGTIIGGGFAGKYNYVSPEQLGLFGGEVTGRSDIYSFGLVLAGVLLGRPVDMDGTQADTIEKRRRLPDLGGLDGRLRPLIAAMLQPDPAHRPASMADVAAWSPDTRPAPAPAAPAPAATPRPPLPARTGAPAGRAGPARRWAIGAVLGAMVLGIGAVATLRMLDEGPKPLPDSPTLMAPSGPPAPAAADALPAPAEAVAVSPPITASPGSEVSSPPSAPAGEPAPAQPSGTDPGRRVAAFLAAYDGGPCFFALARAVTDHSAGIEAFAAAPEAFEDLDRALTAAIGVEPDLVGNRLWSRQCPAAGFLRAAQSNGGGGPDLLLRSTRLRAGQSLAGEIASPAGGAVMLLRVSETGSVEDLSGALTSRGDARDFDLVLSHEGGGPVPQLIVAITTPQPLPALAGSQPAEQVFPALLRSAAAHNQRIGASAKLVLLGG